MAKAVFYIKDHVQDVGYRLFIISKILNSDLEGTALNMPDGRIKVLLEGEKEHIILFWEELRKEKPELAQNPTCTKPAFDESLTVPTAMRSSQELMLGQFSKGVVHLAGIKQELGGKLDTLGKDLGNKLDELPRKIAEAIRS